MPNRSVSRISLAFIVMLLLSATADAQLFRAYLSRTGLDTNPCTLSSPCRLLPSALAAVADGGEIWMLDSANYNIAPVNITKSVTILAVPGALGSVLATGGDAIDVSTAGVYLTLRNLVIVPQPGAGGVSGIHMSNGLSLTIENCVIANLSQFGIVVTGAASVQVTDSTIRGNGGGLVLQDGARATVTRAIVTGGGNGILASGTAAGTTTTVDIADSTVDGAFDGVKAISTNGTAIVKASIRDSRLVGNSDSAIVAESTATAAVTLSLSNSLLSNNNYGIGAFFAGTKVWASGNTISANAVGLYINAGIIESAGNNAVRNNTTADVAGGTVTGIGTI